MKEKKGNFVQTKIDDDLKAKAEKRAEEENRSMANLLRTALIAYLNK